jgi:hypothetical protein
MARGILKAMELERLPEYGEDGVDVSLIRWMLSLTPLERLQALQEFLSSVEQIRTLNHARR